MHALLSFFTGIIFLVSLVPAQAQEHSWKQLYDSATFAMSHDNYEKALPFLRQALPLSYQLYETNKKDSTYGITTNQLSLTLFFLTQYDSAEYFNEQALLAFKKNFGGKSLFYGDALHNAGIMSYARDNYPMAEEYYQQAINIYQEAQLEHSDNYHLYLRRLGDLYTEWNMLEKALSIYQECLDLATLYHGKKSTSYIWSLSGLADIYTELADYKRAELYHEEAYRLAKEVFGENHPWTINIHRFMAILYSELGRYEEALEISQEVLKYYEVNMTKASRGYIMSLANIGVLSFYMKDYDNALTHFEKSATLVKDLLGEESYLNAMLLRYIGRVYDQHHDYQKAISFKEKSLQIMQEIGTRGVEHYLDLESLAGSYAATQDYRKAENLFDEALAGIKNEVGSFHTYYIELLPEYAKLCYLQGNLAQAEKLFKSASEKILWQFSENFAFMNEIEKIKYRKKVDSYFEIFDTYALQRQADNPDITGKMFNNRLVTKSLLLNSIKRLRENIISNADSTLIMRFHEWQSVRSQLAEAYITSTEKRSSEIDSLKEIANNLEKDLSRQSSEFTLAIDTTHYTWQDIRSKLKPGEAAVEMIRFRQYDFSGIGSFTDSVFYAALIITPETEDHPQLVLMKNGNAIENEYLRAYRYDITNQTHEFDTYQWFWSPVASALPNVHTIYFSPDGAYHQLNLTTLFNKQTRKYLLEEVDIRVLATTKELMKAPAKRPHDRSVALFGFPDYDLSVEERRHQRDSLEEPQETFVLNLERGNNDFTPLPGTRTEVENIEHLSKNTGWQTNVFLGKKATEEQVKKVSNPTVLHIATHGYFLSDLDPDDPGVENPLLRSGLLMAGAKISLSDTINRDPLSETILEDGILTAYEVMNLNLFNTELVVLSACETGVGEVKNGEGVYSLQRAFSAAGAESVLMSLWKVNDAVTQEMMRRFYEKWLGGMEKHEALRKAQLQIKKRFPHPYYWGAFVMSGK